jgi:hypothetical protein
MPCPIFDASEVKICELHTAKMSQRTRFELRFIRAGLDQKENEFGEVDLTIGDYEVTLTSAEVMEIIEKLEMIGISVVARR